MRNDVDRGQEGDEQSDPAATTVTATKANDPAETSNASASSTPMESGGARLNVVTRQG
jgi:hypothetical protein